MNTSQSRLVVIDALRGFALISIMLLHNIEHFDFYFNPPDLPEWIQTTDKWIWDTLFFLFGGKSYAIFAFLFGLTFFIQSYNQEKQGKDFRLRFAWRLILLFLFGMINSAFYHGDILSIYAVVGFFLIPFAQLNDRTVFWMAVFFMLQPFEWINFIMSLQEPDKKLGDPLSWAYFGKMWDYVPGNSFMGTVIGNLTNGKTGVVLWNWENGRYFQTLSLFMLGMLAGRKSLFIPTEETKKFWKMTLIISSISFVPLFIIKNNLEKIIDKEAISRPLMTIETSWTNLSFMLVLVSGFFLLFQVNVFYKMLNKLSPIGRMSLSNYLLQSIAGSFIFYGFGLAMYQFTGATYSILIGIFLATLQGLFSAWWIKKYKQGPLEIIWHKLTWLRDK